MNAHEEGYKIVEESDNAEVASTWILILSAARIPHKIEAQDHLFLLLTPEEFYLRADHELASYYSENEHWPPKQISADNFSPQFLPFSLLTISLLAIFYLVTGSWDHQSIWFSAGAGDADAILKGHEFYRLITALTLHADQVHLAGNCIIGGILFHFLCKSTGNGLALLTGLSSAILANLVNVILHGYNHHFVGFSTFVFAVIGIQTALKIRLATNNKQVGIQLVTPLMAGFGLLAVFGSSGERTDLGAHFFGLFCGLFVGLCLHSVIMRYRSSWSVQALSFIVSIIIILLSWWAALTLQS